MKTQRVTLLVSQEDKQRFKSLAEDRGLSVSEFVRQAVAFDCVWRRAADFTTRDMPANDRDNGANERQCEPADDAEDQAQDCCGACRTNGCVHNLYLRHGVSIKPTQNSNLMPCAIGSASE